MTPKPIMVIGNRSTRRYWIGSDRRYDRYNRSLVDRIEDLLDPSFLMDWKLLLAKLRAMYGIPFRSLEGIARIFARITGFATVCYTSIYMIIIAVF